MRRISVGNNLTAGTTTTIYTVPEGYTALWILSYTINNTASAKTLDIIWHDASTATNIHVSTALPVSAKNYVRVADTGTGVQLEEGDYLTFTAEAGSTMTTINTFELERKNAA